MHVGVWAAGVLFMAINAGLLAALTLALRAAPAAGAPLRFLEASLDIAAAAAGRRASRRSGQAAGLERVAAGGTGAGGGGGEPPPEGAIVRARGPR